MIPAPSLPGPPQPALIDVCVCTFRRESLTRTLASIARQTGHSGPIRVIVADNDDAPSGRPQVEAARAMGLDLVYVHAPARNISIARNACLRAAEAPYLAFIDDDEVADVDWLDQLSRPLLRDPLLAATFGPVVAVYPDLAPAWARTADLHSAAPVTTRRGLDTGYTSNAMVRRAAIEGLHFDPDLGRSGGEDTDFFTRLHRRGARFEAAPNALVREDVAFARLNLSWLASRAFRAGQTHARRYLGTGPGRPAAAILALSKAAVCLFLTASRAASPAGWRRAWVRTSLHAGAFARLCGVRERPLYG